MTMAQRPLVSLTAAGCSIRSVDPQRVQAVQTRLLDDEAYVDLAETFRALADSTRAKIIHALSEQPLCVCDLAQVVGVSEPAVSQHLRLLRALRMVRGRRDGKLVYYRLDDAHVRSLLAMALRHREESIAGAAQAAP